MSVLSRMPSAGLLFLTGSWVFLVGFLAWGLTVPNLESVWLLMERMRQPGFSGLRESEVALIESALDQHPRLVETLAGKDGIGLVEPTEGGWSALPITHLILRGQRAAPLRVGVECRAHARAFPIIVALSGDGFSRSLRFDSSGRQHFEVEPGRFLDPTILRVEVTAALPVHVGQYPFQVSFSGELAEPSRETAR